MSDVGIPELRSGPPWVTEEMVAAEPRLVAAMSEGDFGAAVSRIANAVVGAAAAGQPITVFGCGTSEHGAMAVAAQLRTALRASNRPYSLVGSRQAFEAWLDPGPVGVAIAVTHEGGTAATNAAMRRAVDAGSRVMVITARANSEAADLAEESLVTPEVDRSWCHTIGYLSPVLAGALLAHRITDTHPHLEDLSSVVDRTLTRRSAADAIGARLGQANDLLVVGSGLDAIAARELALKIREGARLAATAYPLETVLHGYLVSSEPGDGVIAILTDADPGAARAARVRQVLRAARSIGLETAVIVCEAASAHLDESLTTAGRLMLPLADDGPTASLVASALGLQLVTLGLVTARGTNPDRIRREEAPYREAATIAEDEGLAGGPG